MKKYLLVGLTLTALVVGWGMANNNDFIGTDDKVTKLALSYTDKKPLKSAGQGDLPLFLFGSGGAVAGFYLGYQWREIFGKKEG